MKNNWKILLGLSVLIAIFGCVSQKKKGDAPTGFKRRYHNLTSHYNYWFNADELFRLTTEKQGEGYKDNYNQLLEIYPALASDPKSAATEYDNVIQKASKGIALHRISAWTDDCYLLIAQAQYMKHDYETAETTFQYIKDEHDPKKKNKAKLKGGKKKKSAAEKKKTASKKKKAAAKKKKKAAAEKKKAAAKKKKDAKDKKGKKDEKKPVETPQTEAEKKNAAEAAAAKEEELLRLAGPNPYTKGLGRTAAYPEAMVWFGRTLIAREKYEEAEFLFVGLEEDAWFPESARQELHTAQAQLFIIQKKYERAIEPLTKAIQYTKKKRQKARLSYILAQLCERAGQYDRAYAAFETVLKNRPKYEMEFNARLHQIETGWANGQKTSSEANRSLEKMAKDNKNFDYRDQIYYTMATIAFKDGLKKDGIALLRKSLDYNKGNAPQRAESYLKLADLYFEDEDFVQAKNYYDSTITVLPNSDDRYKRAELYAKNLKDIARLLKLVAENDSLLRVAAMTDAERKDLGKKIKKKREAEQLAATRATNAPLGPGTKAPTQVAGAKPSNFYFYNETFLKKGKKDFVRAWGDRKLEDNWRRSSRLGTNGSEDIVAGDSTKNDLGDKELSDLFAGVPKSPAEIGALNAVTYDAMYQLGTLFRDKIQNSRRSVGTLEEMQTRFPDTLKYEKEAWYYCYLGHTDLTNKDRAKYYYDKLVEKYPNSAYARAISDPNFLNSVDAKKREINKYYEETYSIFQNGNYKDAFDRCQDAPRKFGSQSPIMPKFALLSALCAGNLQGNDAYCKALSEVIARFPDSAEATRAKEIARVLSCKGFEVDTKKTPTSPGGAPIDDAFTREDDKLHYVMVAIIGDVKLDDIKASISDYNREKHKAEQLRLSNIFLGTDTNTPIMVLRKFDNKTQAMLYLNEIKDALDFLGETTKKTYNKEFFALTQENYRRILKNKTLNGYREFFQDNYLK